MVGSHDLIERLEWWVIHDITHLSYIYSKQLHITTLEDSKLHDTHIYNFFKSRNQVQSSNILGIS